MSWLGFAAVAFIAAVFGVGYAVGSAIRARRIRQLVAASYGCWSRELEPRIEQITQVLDSLDQKLDPKLDFDWGWAKAEMRSTALRNIRFYLARTLKSEGEASAVPLEEWIKEVRDLENAIDGLHGNPDGHSLLTIRDVGRIEGWVEALKAFRFNLAEKKSEWVGRNASNPFGWRYDPRVEKIESRLFRMAQATQKAEALQSRAIEEKLKRGFAASWADGRAMERRSLRDLIDSWRTLDKTRENREKAEPPN